MEESLSGTLAIDLGNTNTVVAFQDQKEINSVLVEIPNITSSPGVIPTAVWFEESSKIPKIGISALKMKDNSNSDLFFHSNFKRLIIAIVLIFSFISCSKKEPIYVVEDKIDPYQIYAEGINAFNKNDFFFANKKFSEAELNFEK